MEVRDAFLGFPLVVADYSPHASTGEAVRERPGSPATFRGVQAVRGLAASMVVLYHASGFWWLRLSASHDRPGWQNGRGGVDLFFVVSGFVMAVSTFGKPQGPRPAWKFLERRFVRVMPLYWLITTALLLRKLSEIFAHGGSATGLSLRYVVCSYLLIPARNPSGEILPLVSPGWTLSFEILFYVCLAGVLALRLPILRSLAIGLTALALAGSFRDAGSAAWTSLLNPVLLEFVLGLWLGHAVLRGWRVKPKIAVAVGSVALAVLLASPLPASSWLLRPELALLGLAVVFAAVMLEDKVGGRIPRSLLLLGDASYSLYLTHYLLLNPCLYLMQKALHTPPGSSRMQDEVCSVAFLFVVSLAVAVSIYVLIERPMNRSLRYVLYLRPARAALGHPLGQTASRSRGLLQFR